MENTQTPTKTVIRPNTKNMIKTAGGSFHKDDFIGNALAGLSLQQVKHIAFECGVKVDKYDHLNNGQIRMTLGGVLRKLVKMPEVPEGQDYTEEQANAADAVNNVRGQIIDLADDFRDANKAADADAKAKKEAAKAEKAAAKAVTEQSPVIDDTDSEGGTLD